MYILFSIQDLQQGLECLLSRAVCTHRFYIKPYAQQNSPKGNSSKAIKYTQDDLKSIEHGLVTKDKAEFLTEHQMKDVDDDDNKEEELANNGIPTKDRLKAITPIILTSFARLPIPSNVTPPPSMIVRQHPAPLTQSQIAGLSIMPTSIARPHRPRNTSRSVTSNHDYTSVHEKPVVSKETVSDIGHAVETKSSNLVSSLARRKKGEGNDDEKEEVEADEESVILGAFVLRDSEGCLVRNQDGLIERISLCHKQYDISSTVALEPAELAELIHAPKAIIPFLLSPPRDNSLSTTSSAFPSSTKLSVYRLSDEGEWREWTNVYTVGVPPRPTDSTCGSRDEGQSGGQGCAAGNLEALGGGLSDEASTSMASATSVAASRADFASANLALTRAQHVEEKERRRSLANKFCLSETAFELFHWLDPTSMQVLHTELVDVISGATTGESAVVSPGRRSKRALPTKSPIKRFGSSSNSLVNPSTTMPGVGGHNDRGDDEGEEEAEAEGEETVQWRVGPYELMDVIRFTLCSLEAQVSSSLIAPISGVVGQPFGHKSSPPDSPNSCS
ncbi:unnamed protein product [Protopolystoma xenopodis]|uniref:Uncharacterized protein n=1 Tax=Protopolystoma xenopodis TaxID=117903 RepID=A0A448WGM1_9PLAT|nr:unnamed protein product [Protopolystoma xenopodis]